MTERDESIMQYEIVKIREHSEMLSQAAGFFHEKWGIPLEAYEKSMRECVERKSRVPQWYVVMDGGKIIAGLGVIENDFHDRMDLTPNICAVYVEEAYRKQGIAGEMLSYVCREFSGKGIDTLYLITNLTAFYERYGWEFLCMVQGSGEPEMIRMYIHRQK